MDIIFYDEKYKSIWDNFVYMSKNATFLFFRDYLEYHKDRFKDFSLIIVDKSDVIALFPANVFEDTIYSHGGLTYGGLLLKPNINCDKVLSCFGHLINFLNGYGIKKILYKSIPHIYHKKCSEEDNYALFINNFILYKREPSVTINLKIDKIPGKKINGYKRAIREGLKLEESIYSNNVLDIANYNLLKKYNVKAVHTADEMNYLKSKFPNNIKIFQIVLNNDIIGGAVLYLCNKVVHAQYLALNDTAKKLRGMDFLICSLHEMYKSDFDYFDFGISSEQGGRYLNVNLMRQKEEYGGGTICYDTFIREI